MATPSTFKLVLLAVFNFRGKNVHKNLPIKCSTDKISALGKLFLSQFLFAVLTIKSVS